MIIDTPEILAASRPDCTETQILLNQGGYALWECGDEGHYHTPMSSIVEDYAEENGLAVIDVPTTTDVVKTFKKSRRKRGPVFFLDTYGGKSCSNPNSLKP